MSHRVTETRCKGIAKLPRPHQALYNIKLHMTPPISRVPVRILGYEKLCILLGLPSSPSLPTSRGRGYVAKYAPDQAQTQRFRCFFVLPRSSSSRPLSRSRFLALRSSSSQLSPSSSSSSSPSSEASADALESYSESSSLDSETSSSSLSSIS